MICQIFYAVGNPFFWCVFPHSHNGIGLCLNSYLTPLQRMTLESISAKPPMGLDYLRNAQWGECKSVCVRAKKGRKQSCNWNDFIAWCSWEAKTRLNYRLLFDNGILGRNNIHTLEHLIHSYGSYPKHSFLAQTLDFI